MYDNFLEIQQLKTDYKTQIACCLHAPSGPALGVGVMVGVNE